MDRFVTLVALLAIIPFTMQQGVGEGACECAVFPADVPEPIIERTLQFEVSCDQEGAEKCRQLCVALAEGAKDKAPELICEVLKTHVENLQVELRTRVCNATTWDFSGLKSMDPICCHGGRKAVCGATTSLIAK